MSAAVRFDPAEPLAEGITVLEASAGTGKTHAVAELVAREVAAGPPLDELLVVTFTRKATGTLRDRVRRMLARRRDEGCLTVEMEAASMMAVAQFRGVRFGQLLYGGDDLSGTAWDNRDWQRVSEVRENLFWLCADACLTL